MKKFNAPKMILVRLFTEDVITSSCLSQCLGFQCNDCGSCVGIYSCDVLNNCGPYGSVIPGP